MKKSLFLVFLLFSFFGVAQGDLQFNQVLNPTFTGVAPSTGATLGTITVPVGKVWKIESASYHYYSGSAHVVFTGGADQAYIGSFCVYNFGSQLYFPIWLSAGTYPVICRTTGGFYATLAISVIEFNVVP